MSSDTMQQLQVLDKLREIPLVDAACNTSVDVYNRAKESSILVSLTVGGVKCAFNIASFFASPVTSRLQPPIRMVDAVLCKGVEVLQENVPLVNEQPAQIYETTKEYVSNTAAGQKVQQITTFGWEKANQVLNTSCGSLALYGLDKTSAIADICIDFCLPAAEGELNVHPHPNSECEDKVLHTVHTVSTISVKATKRVCRKICHRSRKNKKTQQKGQQTETQDAEGTDKTSGNDKQSDNDGEAKDKDAATESDEYKTDDKTNDNSNSNDNKTDDNNLSDNNKGDDRNESDDKKSNGTYKTDDNKTDNSNVSDDNKTDDNNKSDDNKKDNRDKSSDDDNNSNDNNTDDKNVLSDDNNKSDADNSESADDAHKSDDTNKTSSEKMIEHESKQY